MKVIALARMFVGDPDSDARRDTWWRSIASMPTSAAFRYRIVAQRGN